MSTDYTSYVMNPRLVLSDAPMQTRHNILIKGIDTNMPWAAGQFLYVDTSGRALAQITSAASVATSGGIKYFALDNTAIGASGTDTVTADVGVITSDMIFEGHKTSTTATTALIGTQSGINVTSASTTGSIVTVDASATYPHVEITDVGYNFDPAAYDSADTCPVIRFKVLDIALQAVPIA